MLYPPLTIALPMFNLFSPFTTTLMHKNTAWNDRTSPQRTAGHALSVKLVDCMRRRLKYNQGTCNNVNNVLCSSYAQMISCCVPGHRYLLCCMLIALFLNLRDVCAKFDISRHPQLHSLLYHAHFMYIFNKTLWIC